LLDVAMVGFCRCAAERLGQSADEFGHFTR